jgi:lysozyme
MSAASSITLTRLVLEEGKRVYAYDDATGERVRAPKGKLSIGIGVNLDTGLDEAEILWLLQHRLGLTEEQLLKFPWYQGLDPQRQSVLLDVGFNAGVAGLLHFPHMLAAVAIKDWLTASAQLLDSEAARTDPHRYIPLAEILKTGVA